MKPHDIVRYDGRPAEVISVSSSGKSVTLKLAPNHYKAVLCKDVQPYTGNHDEARMGLSAPARER